MDKREFTALVMNKLAEGVQKNLPGMGESTKEKVQGALAKVKEKGKDVIKKHGPGYAAGAVTALVAKKLLSKKKKKKEEEDED